MENLCRICRKSCFHDAVPIFSDHKGVPLKQMLTKTCPIDITFDDPVSQLLPQSICTDCFKTVSEAYNLQQVCIESDQYFRFMVAGDLVIVKTEKFEDELDIKVEEIQVDTGMDPGSESDSDDTEEPAPKRKKTKPKSFSEIGLGGLMKIYEKVHFNPREIPNTSDGKKLYICNFCSKKMTPKTILRHMRVHCPGPFPFPCEYCTERFVDLDGLIQHGSRAHSKSDIKSTLFCDICGVSGNKKDGMDHHMMDDHSQTATVHCNFKCSLCGANFKQKDKLDKHLMMTHNDIMTKHSDKYKKLDQHEVQISYKCCKCELDHSTESELFRHLESHRNSSTIQKSRCRLCLKTLRGFSEVIDHAKYHTLPQTHQCLTCKKIFPFDDRFLRHVGGHKRMGSFKAVCSKCQQKFKNAKDLEVHERVKHKNETLFICPICASSLSSASGLDSHIKYIHPSERDEKFQCKSCPAKFPLLARLKKHELIHSTERPHVCETCGGAFKLLYSLNQHKKIHDPNMEKKFVCSQCPKKFATKYKLNQHSLTHSGLKPHECKFCDRAYASKGDLVKHMQKLHVGDAIYQCDKCPRAFRLIVELREHQAEHADSYS